MNPKPMQITVRGEPVTLTAETIRKTREHFVAIYCDCIEDAVCGRTKVNHLREYISGHHQRIQETLRGESDHTMTFIQRAYWIQTGECVALLP